jgi:hypothetical protein
VEYAKENAIEIFVTEFTVAHSEITAVKLSVVVAVQVPSVRVDFVQEYALVSVMEFNVEAYSIVAVVHLSHADAHQEHLV